MKFKSTYFRKDFKLVRVVKNNSIAQRMIWPLSGVLLFEICYLLSLSIAPFSNFKLILFAFLGLISGDVTNKKIQSNKMKKRIFTLRNDFPYFAEHLALCVSAGLSPTLSIKTILEIEFSNSKQSILFFELQIFLSEISEGKSATFALDELAKRINLPEIYRFVDVLIVTMERGTPLASVLRQQALDLREAQRRQFLDLGNKAEIKMMVPVVFLILPVSILFALWPSLYQLNQMSSF
jgi:tight adherence protein C